LKDGLNIVRTFEGFETLLALMVKGIIVFVGVDETHGKSMQLQWVVSRCSHNYNVIVLDVFLL
jgi:hypothetical protein